MTAEPIRVLICDDHGIIRKGVGALLKTETDIKVIGEAASGKTAVQMALELKPDVILMDLMMPDMDGIQATAEITARLPKTRILVLTSYAGNEQVFPAIKAGALGYLLKDSSPEELVQAIHQVHRGESWLHPTIARKVLQELSHPAGANHEVEALTDRELDVLKLLAQGGSNKDIAESLFVSEATVRTHVSNILNKLHVASRTQAALYAIRQGLVNVNDMDEEEK